MISNDSAKIGRNEPAAKHVSHEAKAYRSYSEIPDLKFPSEYPRRVSLQFRAIEFVPMTKETYAASSFLDDRLVEAGPPAWISLERVVGSLDIHNPQISAPLYIFHSAFCCSTLLCRLLDLIPGVMALKEPYLPVQLANELLNGPKDSFDQVEAWSSDEFDRVRSLTDRLLRRVWPDSPYCIVKLSDRCNFMIDCILANHPDAKILFVHGSLRSFLRSVLGRPDRRQWVRKERLELLSSGRLLHPNLHDRDFGSLSDAQAAACVWLDRAFTCGDLAARSTAGSFLAIDGLRLKTDPLAVLQQAAAFYRLDHLITAKTKAAVAEVVRFDAKLPNRPFGSDKSGRATALGDCSLEREIDEGIDWAEQRFNGRNTPMRIH